MPVQLADDLIEFFESGVSILIGTCDASLRPESERGLGAVVGSDRASLTVFVNETLGAITKNNLVLQSEIAVTFSRPSDLKSIQVKGRRTLVRAATVRERAIQKRYLAAYVEELVKVGVSRDLARRIRLWPAFVVELEVRDLFSQTPGSGAGAPLEVLK